MRVNGEYHDEYEMVCKLLSDRADG
jgi:hypothetical protein